MSNRLTFSLASLILIFGLTFVATLVMAHGPGVTPAAIPQDHSHPLNTAIVDDPTTSGVTEAVAAHNNHPRVTSITLKGNNTRGTMAAVSGTTVGTTDVFTLVIAFDRDIVPANDARVVPTGADRGTETALTADADFTDAILNVDGTSSASAVISFANSTRPTGRDDTIEVVVTISGAFPSGTADANDKEFDLRVRVNANAVFSLATQPEFVEVPGGNSLASDIYEFKLVNALPTPGTLTAPSAQPTAKDDGTYDVVFSKGGTAAITGTALMDTATPAALADSYTATLQDDNVTVNVKLNDPTATMEYPAGTITLTLSGMTLGESVTAEFELTVAARSYMDSEVPMVDVLSNPDRQSAAFTINFTATDNDATLEADDITVAITPTTAVTDAAPMATIDADGNGTVMVTPVAATADNTPIPASTINVTVTATDESGNAGMDSVDFYLAERTYVDRIAPTLTATQMTDATTGVITVTLAFSEALQAAPTVAHAAMPAALANTYTVSAVTAATAANTYTVTVTPNALAVGDANLAAGTVTLTVSAMDAAGNALASPGNTVAVALAARTAPGDTTAPTFTHNAPTAPISRATVVTLTFSETVTGVGVTGTPSMDDAKYITVVAGSARSWTVTITPISRTNLAEDMGQRILSLAVSGMDAAGNNVDGSFSLILAARKVAPTPPVTPGNKAPAFAPNAAIASISVTAGTAIERTLPGATDPDGDTITYSIQGTLPTGVSFNATTRRLTGTPSAVMASADYTYVASDGKGGTAALGFSIEVMAMVQTPAFGDIPATYASGVTTITSGMVAANGFVTLGDVSLPDLEEFFELGGTIGLSDGDATDDKNSRTVVISEILWGLDFGAPAAQQTQWQFIELYNTTGAAINLTGWTLTYTSGNVLPTSDIDQISNRGRSGWDVDSGDTGKSGRVTGTLASDITSAITPVNIVSMYRNINYDRVEKTDHNADAAKNREEQLKGVPGGNAKGSWKPSQRRSAYNRWIYDSKRAEHFKATGILSASSVSGTPFRINEIGNDTGKDNDWVELHNVTDAEASLKNYQLSRVTAKGTDTQLFHFHDKPYKVPAKGYVVISTRHPRDTDLAAGKDVSVADDQEENKGASHLYVVRSVDLPDNGKFALILRNNHEGKHLGTGNQLVDVVATSQSAFADVSRATSLWPLTATGGPNGNVIDGGDENFAAGKVYQRNSGNGRGEKHFAVRGFTGIGYDRTAENSAVNGGTPGYDNGAVKEKIADLSNAKVSFSEIMLSLGDGRQNLPQWIEIYNSSMTQAAVTNGWKLHVENTADVETALDAVLNLDGIIIPPNQTILIVTNTGRVSDPDHFPSNRVVNLWTTKKHRDALETKRRTDQVFSTTGLYLKLTDKDNKLVDEFGNLDGNPRTRDELANTWAIPMNGTDDGRRSSLIRVYDDGVAVTGTMAEAWILADVTNLAFAISETYYGDPDDFGTPGFRGGGPLPVSLSKFRPVRLDDGSIRIVWVTESELNNAGFNILRSEKRDGEFKQINTKLIAGQGTTSERTTYTHVDASAKPNVIYYYQIQDVSLDGKVQTLRLSRLKGNVSPDGKLTTTWGELKALQ